MRVATECSGGGGFDWGVITAGVNAELVYALEYDPEIAEVYRQNFGDHVRVENIVDRDPRTVPQMDLYHVSPPCPTFSRLTKQQKLSNRLCRFDLINGRYTENVATWAKGIVATETESDVAIARSICALLRYHQPEWVSLENVWLYRESYSFMLIYFTLLELGYKVGYWHVNFADYGVAQSRTRLMLLAKKTGKFPQLPPASHTDGLHSLFVRQSWVGWAEALGGTSHYKPATIPNWQMESMPEELARLWPIASGSGRVALEGRTGAFRALQYRTPERPFMTITTSSGGNVYKILEWEDGKRPLARRIPYSGLAKLMSFDKEYELPKKKTLAGRIIGNAVPPAYSRALMRHICHIQ